MSLRKDKKKVLGETFDDERIKGFLNHIPPQGVAPDYYLLEKAYRGMHEKNFATFLTFYTEAGFDINARNSAGKTFLETIRRHHLSQPYGELIENLNA